VEIAAERPSYSLTVAVSATAEVLTATEVALHLHTGTATEEDELVRRLLTAARRYCEAVDGRTYLATTYVLRTDAFPSGDPTISLPRPPLRTVSSVRYIDPTGATATLAAAGYTVDTASTPGRLVPALGTTWPSTYAVPNAVMITYVAGSATDPVDVVADRKAAMLLLVGHWFANRESVVVGTISGPVQQTVDALLGVDRASYL
jgi:uncharacterized phiE125 gp8 family phage protein